MTQLSYASVAARLRRADDFPAIAAAVIGELEAWGARGVALTAHDAAGQPTVWAGNPAVDHQAAAAYLRSEYRDDLCLAQVRESLAPVRLRRASGVIWVAPILGCGQLIGTIRIIVDDERDRASELSVVATLVSVRLALLGIEAPLDRHIRAELTDRQHEIACLVSRGCTNSEIAEMLSISANAVKKHVSRVLDALGVSNRTELAGFASRWSGERSPGSRPCHFIELRSLSRGAHA
ncbi:MAG: response regulator transcription factor [Kofleriaceae bacterium]